MTDDHFKRYEGGAEVAADTMRGLTKATFDHTKDYDEYNRKYDAMPDDDSEIPALLQDLKKQHRTGVTRDLDFRISQLKKLKEDQITRMGQAHAEA